MNDNEFREPSPDNAFHASDLRIAEKFKLLLHVEKSLNSHAHLSHLSILPEFRTMYKRLPRLVWDRSPLHPSETVARNIVSHLNATLSSLIGSVR